MCFFFVCSAKLRQTRQMRAGVDTAGGGVPMPHLRHLAVHVHLPRVLPPRRPLHARLQHVPVAGGWRVRLRWQVGHEGGRVSCIHCYTYILISYVLSQKVWQRQPRNISDTPTFYLSCSAMRNTVVTGSKPIESPITISMQRDRGVKCFLCIHNFF
jgi:hypothetical protein